MKCFWCYRLQEEGKISFAQARPAEVIYQGDSMCLGHLDAIRRVGPIRLIDEVVMS